jgi:hypothetical protein
MHYKYAFLFFTLTFVGYAKSLCAQEPTQCMGCVEKSSLEEFRQSMLSVILNLQKNEDQATSFCSYAGHCLKVLEEQIPVVSEEGKGLISTWKEVLSMQKQSIEAEYVDGKPSDLAQKIAKEILNSYVEICSHMESFESLIPTQESLNILKILAV